MWTSGITQGVMLNATTDNGTVLAYPNFLDTINVIRPMMLMRVIGGALYLVGWFLLAYNMVRTIRGARPVNGSIEVYVESAAPGTPELSLLGSIFNPPVLFSVLAFGFACSWMFGGDFMKITGIVGALFCIVVAYVHYESRGKQWAGWYDRLLVTAMPFTVLTLVAVIAGGLIQIIPTVVAQQAANVEDRRQIPYTPLELAGRDLYVSDGCYLCHSQMIRTLVPDVLRYGDYSRLGESIYDHPFQWGSKRNGPDLARVGGKYPNIWHLRHLEDPRSISAGSNMPNFQWLLTDPVDMAALPKKVAVMRMLGVPYPPMSDAAVMANARAQAASIAEDLRAAGATVAPDRQVIALIAYLQELGKFEPVAQKVPEKGSRLSD